MRHHATKVIPIATALLSVPLLGCDDDPVDIENGDAAVRVLLTDAPADFIASAWVDIGAVELVPAAGEEGGIITLSEDGTDGLVDLLELQGTATAELANEEIEAGIYSQLRLIVESAEVELVEGLEFNDGGSRKELVVPSGAQTGIKLNLAVAGDDDGAGGGVQIAGGETVLVVDFDVHQSFVIQGNPETPAGINGVLFTPTLRVTVEDVAGSISGTVSAEDDVIGVEGLVVTAEPLEGGVLESLQTMTATATTGAEGDYILRFLVPGTYVVSVEVSEGFETDPASVEVSVGGSEEVTGVDFTVDEVPPAG